MNRQFTAGSRIAALTVAATLFTSSLALAQTPAPKARHDTDAQPTLMSAAAFARLAQPLKAEMPANVAPNLQRASLQRQSTTLMARDVSTARAQVQQKSWASRHKAVIGVLVVLGAVIGLTIWIQAAED